jgi:hypothetical protein
MTPKVTPDHGNLTPCHDHKYGDFSKVSPLGVRESHIHSLDLLLTFQAGAAHFETSINKCTDRLTELIYKIITMSQNHPPCPTQKNPTQSIVFTRPKP